jgi:hypothetical protein
MAVQLCRRALGDLSEFEIHLMHSVVYSHDCNCARQRRHRYPLSLNDSEIVFLPRKPVLDAKRPSRVQQKASRPTPGTKNKPGHSAGRPSLKDGPKVSNGSKSARKGVKTPHAIETKAPGIFVYILFVYISEFHLMSFCSPGTSQHVYGTS